MLSTILLLPSSSADISASLSFVSLTLLPCLSMISLDSLIISTASLAFFLSSSITSLISPVNLAESSASFLTSSATTAKPLPASPALAASMAAFNERRLVWSEIDCIISLALAIASVASFVS